MTLNLDAVLDGLKDFQRATVDYAYERLFAHDGTKHFLVADEVGLGKTLVARGVVAKTIAHLLAEQERVNIVYVCSNSDIARQNIKRLRIPGVPVAAQATRVTLLATELKGLDNHPVNVIALTPATSFEQTQGGGRYDERVLLHALLDAAWDIGRSKAAVHVLRDGVGTERFRKAIKNFDRSTINPEIKTRFVQALAGQPHLKQRFEELGVAYARSNSRPDEEDRTKRKRWLGTLRQMLAQICLRALQPDLIILDEFQRFGHLLRDTEDTSELARDFLHSGAGLEARVLLLSATPYRALSLHHEANDDHHRDFLTVVGFLQNGALGDMEAVLASYRKALEALTPESGVEGRNAIQTAATALEARLRPIMARTERTTRGNGASMLREVNGATDSLLASDIQGYLGAQRIADALGEGDVVEYWKSAPYLFNFMDDYTLKRAFERRAEDRNLIELVRRNAACFLDRARLDNYRPVDPANPRLRELMAVTVGRGLSKLLWLPPSLPYYGLGGPFTAPDLQGVTKRLVFSAWHMVPRAVASLLSYEVERAMMRAWRKRGQEDRVKQRALLRFNVSADRAAGLPVMLHVYPSLAFAQYCDPRDLAREGARSALAMETQAQRRIGELLAQLNVPEAEDGPADERWYWLVPMLLDDTLFPEESAAWWERAGLAHVWGIGRHTGEANPDEAGWWEHVDEARRVLTDVKDGRSDLGRRPDDLLEVLALAALAAPATCAFRALNRGNARRKAEDTSIREAAGCMGHGFVSLFNHPEVIEMLRAGKKDNAYWRIALDYAHAGCLQAVLDEYLHLLREASDGDDAEAESLPKELSDAAIDALTVRTTNLAVDSIAAPRFTRSVQIAAERMRNRFAMRFGDQRKDEDQPAIDAPSVTRKERVRAAFNSPFWPFVLVSTSVGQEGLDFHHYCHAVTHWNLPSNPVDLEQREGRVHRYKGHAVRKNVAQACGDEALRSGAADVWQEMFECARKQRPADRNDLEPYWLFDGEARIERHVPALPYSRDESRLRELRSALAIYRMVFGQTRQEDLIAYLERALPEADRDEA